MSESHNERQRNLLGALVLAVADSMREATEAAAGHAAAGPAALVALDEFLGGRSMDDLRRALGLTPSGAVRLVDRLVADGCVERRPGANGRSLSLLLTTRGRRLARRVKAARADALEVVLGELSASDRAVLTRINDRLLRSATARRLAVRRERTEAEPAWLCRLCDFDACGRDRGACPANSVSSGQQPDDGSARRGSPPRP